jgi:predicted ATPase/DNA-binding SARP family transcriptional activator
LRARNRSYRYTISRRRCGTAEIPLRAPEKRLEVRILGPLEVLRDGVALEVGPRRHRALLALLLLSANRVVSADRLIEELWAGRPPEGAPKTLRSYVSRLRAAVGEEVLRSRKPGYLLEIDPDELDARRFERLLDEGRKARARGDAAVAAACLREGLALWHGDALADLADEPFADVEARRLEELRLVAIEERIEADLDCGRHHELVAELEALLDEQPLRERLWGQLMTALYRSGRQADALAGYQRARSLLADRLGLETGKELRILEQKILRQELEAAPAQVVERGLPSGTVNLPAQLTSFVDRERELEELTRLLPETPLLTLTGIGGCGKTRLALEAAGSALPRFREGVHLVELGGLTRPEFVPDAVAAAVGAPQPSERAVLESLPDRLRTQALLLVLDNCEHVLDACAELAGRLLSACPQLRILATSREPLGLHGELVYRVSPLSLAEPAEATPDVAGSAAVRLFVERAAAAGWEPDGTPQTLTTVASVCRELDGLPLALELAAARSHVLTVEEIAARLDDRFRFLRYPRRTPEPRHETLGTTMAWSYDLLSEDERALLRGLSVFAGGFTLQAAAAVCLDGDSDAALELLTRLIEGSLVLVDARNGTTRYRMLETVRHYAAERLAEAGEADEARSRHAAYFLELAEELGSWEANDRSRGGSWSAAFEEGDNLRAALGWYVDRGVAESSLRFVCFLTWFWGTTDRIAEGRSWCERALALEGEPQTKSRAEALYAAGTLSWMGGDVARAREFLDQSLHLFEQLGDKLWLTILHDARADLHLVAGDLEAARITYEACRKDFSDLSRPGGVACATLGLGVVHRDLGHRQKARSLFSTAAGAFREQNDPAALAATLHYIADMELDEGEFAVAAQSYAESLSVARARLLGQGQRMTTYSLAGLAAVAAARGDVEGAGLLWGVVKRLEEERGFELPQFERARYEGFIGTVAGSTTFDEAASAGRELSLEQAVDYGRSPK